MFDRNIENENVEESPDSNSLEGQFFNANDVVQKKDVKPQARRDIGEDPVHLHLLDIGRTKRLTRGQEISISKAKDLTRNSYYKSLFSNEYIATKCLDLIENIIETGIGFEHTIECGTRDNIRKKMLKAIMPLHVKTANKLLLENKELFATCQSTHISPFVREMAQTRLHSQREKVAELLIELCIKQSFVDSLLELYKEKNSILNTNADKLIKVNFEIKETKNSTKRLSLIEKREEIQSLLIQATLELCDTPESSDNNLKQIEKYRNTYIEKRNELVEGNYRLVISIAKKYQKRGVPFSDLIQEGNKNLLRAAEKYDYRKGFKFSTYATWWIRQGASRCASTKRTVVAQSVYAVDLMNRVRTGMTQLSICLEREPNIEEIAQITKLTTEQCNELLPFINGEKTLNFMLDESTSLEHVIEDTSISTQEIAESNITQHELKDLMRDSLIDLDLRSQLVLKLRFGFGLQDDERDLIKEEYKENYALPRTHTLAEIGKGLGVSRERVRQIEAKALERLHKEQGDILKNAF